MAQTGYTPISIYYSSTAGNTPTAGNLVAGELAINTADGKLFYKDSAGVVQVIAGKGGAGVAGGSNTQVQYNSSGSLAGSANFTFNGTTVTIANDASISGLTVGKGGGAVASNTVVGASGALGVNTSGANDVAVGAYALQANTTGSQNIGVGQGALYGNTTGSDNTAIGFQPLAGNTTGGQNTAVGRNALASNTTASNNTAVGYQAGYSNTTGTGNTFLGYTAGYASATKPYNTMIGYRAGYGSTGQQNTFVGFQAGGGCTGTSNTFVGPQNDSSGQGSGELMSTGNYNTIIGAFTGNQGGLDIRTSNNYIVLSDGVGNPRVYIDGSGNLNMQTGAIYGQNSSGALLFLGTGSTNAVTIDAGVTSFYPYTDNNRTLGYSTRRWTVVYATTGTINTSDANQKQQIRSLDDAELAVAKRIKGLIKAYKLNASVAEKGDGARIHIGVIAQEVQSAFIAEGLDPSKYGMFCSDTHYEVDGKDQDENHTWHTKDTPNAVEVTQLGIRYEELLAFVIATL